MPFLLCPRMLRAPTVQFYAQNLSVPHTPADLTGPHFYATQSRKLQALLDTTVAEGSRTHDARAREEYAELAGALAEMLREAQFYAVLSSEELREREAFVAFFLAKVDTVKGTIADWDARGRRLRKVSRKRGRRSVELHAEGMVGMKRRREGGEGVGADMYGVEPFPQAWPAMELDASSPASPPWWAQPYCD